MDGLKQLIENLKQKLSDLSFNQKVMLGAVAVAAIISISVFSLWLQQDTMGVLFTNLSREDAGATIDELRKLNVKFELKNDGTTILVPENEVLSLRIDLQHKGVITDSVVGFEIFDNTKMTTVTEFMQNVNFKRATEGELTKTIESLRGIQSARVHLVMPKPSIFNKQQNGASASVMVKLGRGVQLNESQIAGIQSLVSSSVQNLAPDAVRVHDTSGRELSAAVKDDEVGRSETQLELRQEVERHLASKAGTMLDRVLGAGKAVVEVNATLNFEKIESEREIFDPQGVVTRSEERDETNDPATGSAEKSLTNYEINRTVEHIVSETGNVTNLMVSVVVDGHYEPSEEDGEPVYTPLSENEIGQLRRIVSNAVGLNTVRGDQIEFVNFQFQQGDPLAGGGFTPDWIGMVTQYGGRALMIILFGILALTLRSSLGGMLAGATQASGAGGVGGAAGDAGVAGSDEHFEGIPEIDDQIMNDIQDYAAENPERVAEVVQSWIQDINLGSAMSANAGE